MLQDRAFIEQMKADILRRAEAMSDDEEEGDAAHGGKSQGNDVAFEEELDEDGGVKVRDGQASEGEGDEETDADEEVRLRIPLIIILTSLSFRSLKHPRNPRLSLSLRTSVTQNCSTEMPRLAEARHGKILGRRLVSLPTVSPK